MCILSPLMDNRFSNAWVLLGHVLAAQEESEHAISAYRTACRVLPGNHEPQVFMAKELVSAHGYPHHHPHPPPPVLAMLRFEQTITPWRFMSSQKHWSCVLTIQRS
jgi:hypothetical protein